MTADHREQQASLEERLRSVPNYWRITIESDESFPSSRHIPVGPMCHEAADALASLREERDKALADLKMAMRRWRSASPFYDELGAT